MQAISRLPASYHEDIIHAVQILKEAGCQRVFLFGSLATGDVTTQSDIDLAVRGCPKGSFFHLLGRLMLELEHPVDLISLDQPSQFTRFLETEGELLELA
jgi:predicted nucleotidyltransferase